VYSPIVPEPQFATNRSDPDNARPHGKLNPETSEALTVVPEVVYSPIVPEPLFVTKISCPRAVGDEAAAKPKAAANSDAKRE
jgi:hypothetical protein